ncbi:MAG TPA: hypothetical protein VKQ08_05745 [Cyclobacteriaceae bacterium]|nr:hypothetical protein [Cyclobacteriaceae bacterium]
MLSRIRYRLFIFKALFKLKVLGTSMNVLDGIGRHLRHKRRHEINYQIDEFLKMENPEKAYWALCGAMQKEKHRELLPAELRVLSLADFTGNCLTNGFITFDGNARWAIVSAAELMDAIDEPAFAKELWACIAICREYGKKVGRDPFDPNVEYVALDEETEKKLYAREFDFTDYVDPATDERLFPKTMDYVRKNRELFIPPNKP